ncbi:MAG: glycosyltransferase family 39 protein [Acidobacteria bacterium]|nr:glycosyltransferase family 39 protein [Acidobacteriota bacterium]
MGFRLFSIGTGMLTILLIYRLAREWSGPRAALWSAGLLALNEYHVGISIFAVEKTYYVFFSLLAIYLFWRFLTQPRPKWLFLAALCCGLASLCHEVTVLLVPVFFLTLLLSPTHRAWLLRKEPYLAAVLYAAVLSPDLYWNARHTAASRHEASYRDHLARIGGIGFTRQPFLFYSGDAARQIYTRMGGRPTVKATIYPAMNVLFGAILMAAITLASIRARRSDGTSVLLLVLFWTVFLFFVLIRPSRETKLDPVMWFWVTLTLLPAVLIAGRWLAHLQGRWLLAASTVAGCAGLWSVAAIVGRHLDLPSFTVVFRPGSLFPPDGRMVDIRAAFHSCTLCGSRFQLLDIRILDEREQGSSGIGTPDVEGARLQADSRSFRLRARFNAASDLRNYQPVYRALDPPLGRSHALVTDLVRVRSTPVDFPPVFW